LDLRLVAATNVHLEEAVEAGKFRQDLYYRLNVATVRLPSLRERRGDIMPLIEHFTDKYRHQLGLGPIAFTAAAKQALLTHRWAGNIRELENVVHSALILCDSAVIDLPHLRLLPLSRSDAARIAAETTSPEAILTDGLRRLLASDVEAVYETVERLLIHTAFEHSNGNQVRTARRLGISRNILRAQLKQYGMLNEKTPDMTGPANHDEPEEVQPDFTLPSVRFRHASRYYTTGRPAYPPLLIERVVDLVGLRYEDRVLDLGTGPGFLAFNFAAFAGDITAIDPSPDMLEVARVNAAQTGADITFVEASSEDLGPRFGRFRLVTIGRAFPWMDRQDTLRRLDELIMGDGAVVLFSDKTPDIPANAWAKAFREIRERYASMDESRVESRLAKQSNESFLFASPFNQVERLCVSESRATPIERFVDRILSFGSTWTRADPLRAKEIDEEVHAALAPYAVDGIIQEVVEGEAIVARRSH
jgi:SAM-dependent methyltransferase/DNA-binding protein Fis